MDGIPRPQFKRNSFKRDGIYTPASSQGYLWDIKTMKKLGFNMLRKHIKIETDLFYYYRDKYGMIVFQDMVNSGKYNFFIDTALPTAGIKHHASPKRKMYFEQSARLTVQHLYNRFLTRAGGSTTPTVFTVS